VKNLPLGTRSRRLALNVYWYRKVAASADATPSDVLVSCLTVPPHKTSVEIEQATTSYSFRFSELSQPI